MQADLASDDDVDDDDWTATGSHRNEDHRIMSEGGRGRRRKKDKNSPRRKKWKTSNSNNSSNNGDSNHSGGALTSSSASAVSGVATAGTCHSIIWISFYFYLQFYNLIFIFPGLTAEGALATGPADFTGATGAAGIEAMAVADRRTILTNMCGVVSEHTGRMCTRSLRCPQHTDVQRKGVRQVMLEHDSLLDAAAVAGIGLGDSKDKEIDVDTWEEGDSLASLLTAQVWRLFFFLLNYLLEFRSYSFKASHCYRSTWNPHDTAAYSVMQRWPVLFF